MHEEFIYACNDDGGYGKPMIMMGSYEGLLRNLGDRGMRASGGEPKRQ
jgi:hypothetical protein